MSQLPQDITFDSWVQHVFDHPVLNDGPWYFDFDELDEGRTRDRIDAMPRALTLSYMIQLFQAPEFLIKQYSRAQIDQGLHYLVSPSCSNHMSVLQNSSLPRSDRCACVDAMYPLLARLMAPVYGDDLGSTATGPDSYYTCYMWWDEIPIHGAPPPDLDNITDAVLKVLEKILTLDSEACLESALHGLNHRHPYVPQRTEPIVQAFLSSGRNMSPVLRKYAEGALRGILQ